MRTIIVLAYILSAACLPIRSQSPTDSIFKQAQLTSSLLPAERVYLHFDNTAYYLGETIWFKAFVTSHNDDNPTELSRVLYVELMSPEGYVVKTEKYKIKENGTCEGAIYMDTQYMSGFFEIRAYTRYMLNWGDEAIFSRVFPVYDKVHNGDWGFRNIRDRSKGFFANKILKKDKQPELRFYPESGHLVRGIESRVAYELTEFNGAATNDTITILADGKELLRTAPEHMGKGVFTICPDSGVEYKAIVYITDKKGKREKYAFELPQMVSHGCVVSVMEHGDSIQMQIRSNLKSAAEIGLAILHRNDLGFYRKLDGASTCFSIAKSEMHEGVNRAILFQGRQPLAERLFFVSHDTIGSTDRECVKLKVTSNGYMLHNLELKSHERISVTVEREDGKPIGNDVELAVSVADQAGRQTTSWGYNLYTYMLLGSELKGYIPDAYQYFDTNNKKRKEHLDLIMLTNGWTAYSWEGLTKQSIDGIVLPEEGITMSGEFVRRVKNRKMGDRNRYNIIKLPYNLVRIDFTGNDDYIKATTFRTNKNGKFILLFDDFYGKQTVALSPETVLRHSDNINYAFFIDKYFSPEPQPMNFWQLYAGSSIRHHENEKPDSTIKKIGTREYQLGEVHVKANYNEALTKTAPISELRLDYLDEWEYATDVVYRKGVFDMHKYRGNSDKMNEDNGFITYEPSRERDIAFAYKDVLTVANVLASIYKRYNIGWQWWVQPVVLKGEYHRDSIPEIDKKYLYGIDVEAMTNFKEVILTSEPSKLETVTASSAIWKHRYNVLENKRPYSFFYNGFLSQLNITYDFSENESRIYDKGAKDYMSNTFMRIIGSQNEIVPNMEHPNNIAYLIPDNRDNSTAIKNDLSVSSSTRRYTTIQGYSVEKEFYSPDYSGIVPEGNDFRRTLLWNPSVKATDGKIQIELYNSSICNAISVDVTGYHDNVIYSNDNCIETREYRIPYHDRDRNAGKKSIANLGNTENTKKDSALWKECEKKFNTAEIYFNKRNYKKARTSYIELIQYNYPPAFLKIGEFYLKGINLKKRYDLAAEFFEKGAELGIPECYYELSQMYRLGLHCEADKENEIINIEMAAELGEPRAMLQFGKYLLNGDGIEKDSVRAAGFLYRGALENNPHCMYEYATLLIESGIVNDSILGTPLHCIENAAKNGSGEAMLWMSRHEEKNGNLRKSYEYAKELYLMDDIRGTMLLADKYRHGQGVSRDKRLAKDLYREAAKKGNEEAKRILKEW